MLFVLNQTFQSFFDSCFIILNIFRKSLKNVRYYFNHVRFCYFFFPSIHLLLLCGSFELNPGPKIQNIVLCHWNLYSLPAHNFKLGKEIFNIYLVSTFSSDDNNLCLDGYKLTGANHPNNIKQGRVCNYYWEILPVKTIQTNYLPEALVCDVDHEDKKN